MLKIRNSKNFVDLKIDYVLKLGGSLINDIDKARILAEELAKLADKYRIVVFPGGGPIDNYIEAFDKKEMLFENTHHQACARAQDQTGLLFANFNLDVFKTTEDFAGVNEILEKGKIPILLPSKLIFALDPFKKSWSISSDSMCAYFSYLLEADKFVILTDVDGIYDKDPNKNSDAKLIRNISVDELEVKGHTAVDETMSCFLKNAQMDCWVINGLEVDNLIDFFNGNAKSNFTKISYINNSANE